jgi:putative ABC transport system permease protein
VSVLDRKLRRELKASWLMLVAIISIVAVGVACFISMGSAYSNLNEAKRRYYAQCRMADFSIELKKAPLAELAALADLPGVEKIRPRIQSFATVDLESAVQQRRGPGLWAALERAEEPLNGLVLSLPDRRQPIVDDIVLRQGGYFTDSRENEVIVNDAFARHHRLRPGQWIHLVLNNRRQELFVVGTAISSEFVYLLGPGAITPDPEHFGVFYLKRSYAEEVFDFDGAANQVVGLLSPEVRDHPRALLRRMEDLLSPYGVFSTIPLADQPSNKYLSQEIKGLRSFGLVLPVIFLAVAALVLNVLLTRLADQQRTVVGTLKALGYSDRQIFVHFLKFGLAVGLAGGVLGCGVGYWFAGRWTLMYRRFFEFPELQNHFYPGLQTAGLTISVLCAVLGSIRGTRAVLKLQPAEAMRPKTPQQGGAVLLERAAWLWNRLSSGWRMVLRGVIRNRVRTAAGIFAAMMGASILVTGFMMIDATYYLIDFQFKYILRSDVDLSFKDEHSEAALLEAARLPGVDHAEPVLNVGCTFFNGPYQKKGAITGLLSGATLTVPRDLDARALRVPSAGLAMNRKLAELLHLKRGDLVSFQPVKGLRRRHQVPVVEVSESYVGTAVYADIYYLSRQIGEELALSGVQLATDGTKAHTAELYRQLKQMPALQAVNTRVSMIRNLQKTLTDLMWVLVVILVLFAGVVFFGSILNSSLVSLAERQREVATLRVLGYGPWQIGSLLLRESLIVTLVGTVLGMPLGYGLSELVAMAYDTEMFRFPVVSSPGTWIWTGLLAVVFTLAAHLGVQRAVHRMNWLDALQAKE